LTFFEVVAPVETSPRAFPNVRDLAETSSGREGLDLVFLPQNLIVTSLKQGVLQPGCTDW
jgi:hypothetical protein